MFDAIKLKSDFPIFKYHPNLVYLDSTATALKPQMVIDKANEYYQKYSANIFRGIYQLSEKATVEYEQVREKVAKFINAKNPSEIVFVRNATEAINLVADTWGDVEIKSGDEIVTTIMEHHANFVPWQQLCLRKQADFKVAEIDDQGRIIDADLLSLVTSRTKLVALTHVSNVLGTIVPVKELIKKIKKKNPTCLVLVDGAQAVPHLPVNVQDLGGDFYAFSCHKMLGPTGVGVLWGRYDLLAAMPPYQYGGDMIEAVYVDKTSFQKPPHKYEAGTPHIAGVIGLGAAIDYLQSWGMKNIRKHEQELVTYGLNKLGKLAQLKVYGPSNPDIKCGVLAFTIKGVHAHDIAQILDSSNICVRSGHHCAMPLHIKLGLAATTRASVFLYNTYEDIDRLVEGIKQVQKIFR